MANLAMTVIVNTNPLSYVCLCYVFRCFLDSCITQDIALVQWFKSSKWVPDTLWKNCQVYEEKDHAFILLKYVVRACHMIPAFGSSKGKHYYLNDLIDSDMFLHCGN